MGVVERCVVKGTNNTINSIVTVFVRRVYGCDWQQIETGSDTELELFVGNEYKKWWLETSGRACSDSGRKPGPCSWPVVAELARAVAREDQTGEFRAVAGGPF